MYTRGSAAIAILSHHAMILWLLRPRGTRGVIARYRLKALHCLPNWRPHSMPDIEASPCHTVEEYTSRAYWESFDGAVDDVKTGIVSCLEEFVTGTESSGTDAK